MGTSSSWPPSLVRYVWRHVYCCLQRGALPGSCDGEPYRYEESQPQDQWSLPRAWQRVAWLRADVQLGLEHLRTAWPRRYLQGAVSIMVRGPVVRRGPDPEGATIPQDDWDRQLIGPFRRRDLGAVSWDECARRWGRRRRALQDDSWAACIIVSRYLTTRQVTTEEELRRLSERGELAQLAERMDEEMREV